MNKFTFDGHDYIDNGSFIDDAEGQLVVTVAYCPIGEEFIAEAFDSSSYSVVHRNEPDARMTAIKSAISGQY